MNDLIDSVLSMHLDVYKQTEVQDPDTGAIVREWSYYKTVSCHAKGVIRLTPREKVTNIRDNEGNVIWHEINFPSETPTVFEVMGTTPVTDPFGRVIAYNSSMKRSENQQIGQ